MHIPTILIIHDANHRNRLNGIKKKPQFSAINRDPRSLSNSNALLENTACYRVNISMDIDALRIE